MKYIRIIPSLLLYNKSLVKGKNFKDHKNVGNPETICKALESQGADEFFLIDLASYRNEKKFDLETLKKISENISTPITVGGGLQSFEEVKKLFNFGADKVYFSKLLYNNVELIKEVSYTYGKQALVLGVNLIKKNNNYFIYENMKEPLYYISKIVNELKIGELKVTFVDREGTGSGLDLNYIKKIQDEINAEIIFEGGIGSLNHIKQSLNSGVKNLAVGNILFFSDNNLIKIKQYLKNNNFKVRNW